MCKLITVLKEDGDNKLVRALLVAQYEKLTNEKDGIGALATDGDKLGIGRDDKVSGYREVFDKAVEAVPGSNLIGLHTRTATSGANDLSNVHFFEHNGWYMAHNGFTLSKSEAMESKDEKNLLLPATIESNKETVLDEISRLEAITNDCANCLSSASRGYVCKRHKSIGDRIKKIEPLVEGLQKIGFETSSGQSYHFEGNHGKDWNSRRPDWYGYKTGKSDTHLFLTNLPKKLDEEKLAEYAKSEGFSGMAIIYNSELKEGYLIIVRKNCYMVVPKDKEADGDFMMLFSYEPDTTCEARMKGDYRGIPFYSKEDIGVVLV